MHARSLINRRLLGATPLRPCCALVAAVTALLAAVAGAQQPAASPPTAPIVVGQPQAYTPQLGRSAPPAELNIPGSPAPEDPLAAAARAILSAAGAAGPAAQAAAPAAPSNPFATPTAAPVANAAVPPAAGEPLPSPQQAILVPATKPDPERVVVNENDGLISLMVREGSLRQVIAMIADTQKLNIVFAGPNDVNVTASFDRQPWQTVLNSLLSASGHTWAVHDNVIFVASLEQTAFLPPGAEGRRVAVFELDFASAVDVDQTIKGLLSPAGESWMVETSKSDNRRTRESVAVVDFPANLQRISDYICQADQPPRQVFIEVHILQVELEDDCKSGVNFENLISLNSADVTLQSLGMANEAAPTAFFVDVDGVGLDGLIELLQTTTDTKTLASPNIHAVSGQESHIQIGGQLGYRITTTTQTSTMESVQFLDVGVVLRVTPRITRDGRVLMRIFPKVSTGQVDVETGLPSEETTEVETDVLLSSGQGVVIGGLIQESDNNLQSKIPFLGDIPYLGILFQRRQVTRSRQEIIVTLQPHVLPYSPVMQARQDHAFMRTEMPLTQGAIASFPRPYEPRLPDTFFHNKHHQAKVEAAAYQDGAAMPGEPMDLPPIGEVYESDAPLPVDAYDAVPEELPALGEGEQIGPALH